MPELTQTARTRLKRAHMRGSYDRDTINAILDAALICHVGFSHKGQPAVIPTACWREGDHFYVHGSSKNRLAIACRDGADCCIVATHLDGLVFGRSAMHHSMNYRSVVLYGQPEEITDPDHKMRSLERFINKFAPGRWTEVREPNVQELKATAVLRVPIDEASAKMRTGGPLDDEADMALPVWAGVVPLDLTAGQPIGDPLQPADRPIPEYTRHFAANTRKD